MQHENIVVELYGTNAHSYTNFPSAYFYNDDNSVTMISDRNGLSFLLNGARFHTHMMATQNSMVYRTAFVNEHSTDVDRNDLKLFSFRMETDMVGLIPH
jgi:hypothetical protein